MRSGLVTVLAIAASSLVLAQEPARPTQTPAGGANLSPAGVTLLTEADCTAAKLGSAIPVAAIGEPVVAVTLDAPQWHAEEAGVGAYCSIEGSMAPVDKSPTAKPIRFGVTLPASWALRAAQMGGGGNNGTIPRLNGGIMRGGAPLVQQGFATYGSDSGHQAGRPPALSGAGRGAGAPDPSADEWALNDEAVANLGYLQLKTTHDAAMIIAQRAYGERPRYNYFFGNSQGGREALTVAQRYPADYDGISAEVPIVSYSSLMLAPELIRIREKPLANRVTSFGMWFPNTDPSGSGLIASTRFRGQEGAPEDAPMHRHLGVVGVTGILMRDLKANPLDYVEGGPLNRRRVEVSAILDSTNPDLTAFRKRGGKLMVVIGTNDTLSSPGAQVAYYQSVIDTLGRRCVRAVLRAAADRPRPERQDVQRGWRRQGDRRPAGPEHV